LDTEGINCFDINRKFPHFKKERQWETSANRAFWKVKHKHHDRREKLQKIATLIRNNNKKALKSAMPKYRNHIVFQAETQILKIEKKSLGKTSKL